MDAKTCEHCGKIFYPPTKYPIASAQWERRRFCSSACSGWSRRRVLQTKPCVMCGTEFKRNPSYGVDRWAQAQFCSVACRSKYRVGDKHQNWKGGFTHLRFKYGISGEQYQAMLDGQGGVCAICRDRPATCVDHDHESGQVRSLLCSQCNSALGMFRDDPELADRAAEYLRSWLHVDIG